MQQRPDKMGVELNSGNYAVEAPIVLAIAPRCQNFLTLRHPHSHHQCQAYQQPIQDDRPQPQLCIPSV
ncbi:MAG: hypothetical protein EAZ28_06220 [Oscillatoriales cyanobacterium]|nr:MAG: hypothetical protein EAZ28_06220 [Oscillatoriales cyanobacterium]